MNPTRDDPSKAAVTMRKGVAVTYLLQAPILDLYIATIDSFCRQQHQLPDKRRCRSVSFLLTHHRIIRRGHQAFMKIVDHNARDSFIHVVRDLRSRKMSSSLFAALTLGRPVIESPAKEVSA